MLNNEYIADRFSAIAALISDAKDWANLDARLDAHLAAYVCVLLSGAIEDAIERIISLRIAALGDNETESYVIKVLGERFRNPDWGAINGLLGEFSGSRPVKWCKSASSC